MRDYDFHPDEDTVRCFGVPSSGVLVNDDSRCIYQIRGDGPASGNGIVLRHYAFADEWFKLNVTFDPAGTVIETGPGPISFAANCDIATPMVRIGEDISAVDLFIDVLVRADGSSYMVTDRDEFEDACAAGLVSPAEARAAERGLQRLVGWIESGRLWSLIIEIDPAIAADAPRPLPFQRTPIGQSPTVMAGRRPTWNAPCLGTET